MRVTRLSHPHDPNKILTKAKTPRRKIKRMIPESAIPSVTHITDLLNIPGKFSYIDFERNRGAIEMFRHQINQAIFNYGTDLQYFRKYNTFFKDDEIEENHSNLIYGEDTTAEYYASGFIRAYVSVENMAWNFNQIGLEATEQITIFISIDNFEQTFQNKIAKTETRYFEVPVSGDTIHNEVVGSIYEQEFQANIYARFSENDMKVHHSEITVIPKEVNNSFYKSLYYQPNESEISGDLIGRLKFDKEKPFLVNGILKGDLTFHNSKNLEDSESWKRLAPQVGDYFKFKVDSGINEEWEITQVFDKNLTKSGINPLLGKYIYQVLAVKRVSSFEKNTLELDTKEPGQDIQELFKNIADPNQEIMPDQYVVKKKKNKRNKETNQLGHNIYSYPEKADETYGGVQTEIKSK